MSSAIGTQDLATNENLQQSPLADAASSVASTWRSVVRNWLVQDSPYIAMLLLALFGVTFHMPATFWVILTPVFAIICITTGWRHFEREQDRLQLAYTQALSWFALIFTIYVLYNNVVQGVLNSSATSLAMMTLLALGTFVAGLQSRVWRICAVGGLLLLAVPAMGWLEQSALLIAIIIIAVIAVGFLTWWVSHRQWGGARQA
jgi:cation transport ATPase